MLKLYSETLDTQTLKLKKINYENLKQGDKIKYKRWGSDLEYIGRIEVKNGVKYFCSEHNYENILLLETIKYYNPLIDFEEFTEFEIIVE